MKASTLVFLNLVYHEIEDKNTALSEFRRLLKPSGNIAIREKTENTLLPVGPPVIPVDAIRSHLQDAGFSKAFGVGSRGKTIIIGVK
jgi:ubiquinone/menaquinone biosynthesis C-methylase UbiE